jgi:hypothetical protein
MADSHTQILPRTFGLALRKNHGRIFLPIAKIDGRYYLTHHAHGVKAGTEINKINNINIDSIFNIAADFVAVEGNAQSLKDELTAHVFSSILPFLIPLEVDEEFTLLINEFDTVSSQALDRKNYFKKREAYFEKIVPEKDEVAYDLYPDEQIGVLKMHTFAPLNVRKANRRIHRFFAWCNEYDLKIIIDLRNNGGGSANLVQYLYSYLDSSGYCTPHNVVWKSSELSKIPRGLREVLFPRRFEKKVLTNEDYKSYYRAIRSPINTLDTIYMQHAKKSQLVCTLIGTTCNGGMTGTWGNAKMYFLPITGIGYSISTIRYNYNGDFKYDLNPIEPDYEFKIKPEYFESDFDYLLEELLEYGLKEVR